MRRGGRTSGAPDAQGKRRTFLSFKLDPSKVPGHAGAAADVRDLRLQHALRGRASARRQRRARRVALVGSPGGLPHRDPRAREGADRQERRHRAGRKQGRVRAEARAVAGGPRSVHEGGRRLLPGLPARRSSTSPTTSSAATVVPPPQVRRHDADDPYLVVAADKGTATFSDYANAISAEYGFWLGDAFASGGSVGYDHKKMGITARGAWEVGQAPFPRDGRRHANDRFHRRGHRRHVR